jgi:hypothetical protein
MPCVQRCRPRIESRPEHDQVVWQRFEFAGKRAREVGAFVVVVVNFGVSIKENICPHQASPCIGV